MKEEKKLKKLGFALRREFFGEVVLCLRVGLQCMHINMHIKNE